MLNLKSMLKQIKSDVHSDVSTVVFAKSQDIIPLNFDFNFSSINLQKYCVDSDNEDLFIIPEVISEVEQEMFQKWLDINDSYYVQLRGRRVQNWGGVPSMDGLCSPQNLPELLEKLAIHCGKMSAVFPENKQPNHVLINEYNAGDGIMPHSDGPAYFPTVVILSLFSHTCFEFRKSVSDAPFKSVMIPPRSLLIFRGTYYHNVLHGIDSRSIDTKEEFIEKYGRACEFVGDWTEEKIRTKRVSITVRHVKPFVASEQIQSPTNMI